jgi:hypothetical protein
MINVQPVLGNAVPVLRPDFDIPERKVAVVLVAAHTHQINVW